MSEQIQKLDSRSKALRSLILDAMVGGGRGHLGPALSLVEVLRVLYDDVMRHKPADPHWAERDRCLLSKGHGCLALYAILADHGYFDRSELEGFCSTRSRLGGHPEHNKPPGVEASTGALGHGLSIAVGISMALRIQRNPAHVFVVMGDGEIQEGSVWEAAMSASKHQLANLTAIIDYNKMQSYGQVQHVMPLEPLADKWRAFGFEVIEVDGHAIEPLRIALAPANRGQNGAPKLVICHSIKGCGLPGVEHNPDWHHKNKIDPKQLAQFRQILEN